MQDIRIPSPANAVAPRKPGGKTISFAEAGARKGLRRLPLLAAGMLSLLFGIWGGLIRLSLNLPYPVRNSNWIVHHGPLMVCGFLGTVIALERAVGLGKSWTYLAPALTATGAVVLITGLPALPAKLLFVFGSAIFAGVTVRVVRMQRATFTTVMSLGAFTWLTGNLLWATGWPVCRVVPWWIAFLALTIVGERLDLSRFQRPVRGAQPLLKASLGVFLAGIALGPFAQKSGECTAGIGLFALALWLGRFDIARRTVKQTGLPRFMAVCLLVGYVWLAVCGLLLCLLPPLTAGFGYDATLHSFFLGFVFSMIFGHAPVIFPAVLGRPISFRAAFYGHAFILHAGLALRVTGDLFLQPHWRQWGGILNAVAMALFLANTIRAVASAKPSLTQNAGPRLA